ncbi:hypothetical protein ACI8B_110087 [Acinetobacter proteolyticus]|uniref:Uncharacterized protein n=1 Tax=Acinetobacter proteolyticus TaxID=1776741 RepID=A0A653K1C8_9GAMM|nr:hypothetical protein ACI8B_110087 [Acinetobacter proteolyticus]
MVLHSSFGLYYLRLLTVNNKHKLDKNAWIHHLYDVPDPNEINNELIFNKEKLEWQLV